MLQPLEKKIPKVRKQRKLALKDVKEPTETKSETPKKKKSIKKRGTKRIKAKLVEGSSELKSKGEGGHNIQENTADDGLRPQEVIESVEKDTTREKVCEAIHEVDTKEIYKIEEEEDKPKKKKDPGETKSEQDKKMNLLFKRFRRKKEQSRFEKAMKIVKEHKRRKNKAGSETKSETKQPKTNKKIVEVS